MLDKLYNLSNLHLQIYKIISKVSLSHSGFILTVRESSLVIGSETAVIGSNSLLL